MSITDFGVWNSSTNPMIDFEEYNFLVRRGLASPYAFLVRYNSTSSVYEALYGDEEVAGQVAFGGEDNLGSTTGTNSAAVINAALDAVSGTAMERVVLQGPFSAVEAQLDITKAYTYLDLRQASLTLANSVDDDLIEVTTGIDDWWIHGGVLNGNDVNNAAGDCVKVNNSKDFWISDIFCTGANDYGIEYANASAGRGSIQNVYVTTCGTGGIVLDGSENRLTNSHINGVTGSCVTVNSVRDVISACEITDGTVDGIAVTAASTDTVITSCLINSNTQDGISLNATAHRTLITGNTIGSNDYHGISVASDLNTITGNHLFNNSLGNANTYSNIDLDAGGDRNVIVGNNISSNGTASKYGIDVASDFNRITGNVLYNHATAELWNSGTDNSFDRHIMAPSNLDLSGGASDIEVFYCNAPAILCGYDIVYTEASSGDAGVTVRVGRYQDGVALDDDYFDTSTSAVGKNLGGVQVRVSADLTQMNIIEGDMVTVGTAGGKVGLGEVRYALYIAEVSDT